jgi:hypothetical protein
MHIKRNYKRFLSGDVTRPDKAVYIFKSAAYKSVQAFTTDRTGANLPESFAPWKAASAYPYSPRSGLADTIIIALRDRGFFLLAGDHPGQRKGM